MERRHFLQAAAAGAAAATTLALAPAVALAHRSRAAAAPTGDTLRVSDLGFDPDDSTRFLQAALDSDAATVIIDSVGADWITGPLLLARSDVTIRLEPGVTVRAKSGAFADRFACLLAMERCSRVHLVGPDAVLAMNKTEYTTGEWRHALSIRACSEVTVEDLTIRDSGGDGIYLVGLGDVDGLRWCSDIVLRNVMVDNHRRNGLSVISVDGLVAEGCTFRRSSGTAPQAAVDLEPNQPYQRLSRIVFTDCLMDDTASSPLQVQVFKLDGTSHPLSVTFEHCTIGTRRSPAPSVLMYGSFTDDPSGVVTLRNCVIASGPQVGSLVVGQKRARESFEIVLDHTVIVDQGNAPSGWALDVMTMLPGRTNLANPVGEAYGGVRWDECVLVTDQQIALSARTLPPHPGVAELRGRVYTLSASAPSIDLGTDPDVASTTLQLVRVGPPTMRQARQARSDAPLGHALRVLARVPREGLPARLRPLAATV